MSSFEKMLALSYTERDTAAVLMDVARSAIASSIWILTSPARCRFLRSFEASAQDFANARRARGQRGHQARSNARDGVRYCFAFRPASG
jgi:hypothetical protein